MRKQIFHQIGFSKNLLIILVAVVILTGIIGGVLYLQKREIKPQPPSVQPPTIQPTPVPAEIVLAKRLIKSEDIILEK